MLDSKWVERFMSVLLLTWVQSLILCGDKKIMRGMLASKDQTCKNFTELHRGEKKKIKQRVNCSSED